MAWTLPGLLPAPSLDNAARTLFDSCHGRSVDIREAQRLDELQFAHAGFQGSKGPHTHAGRSPHLELSDTAFLAQLAERHAQRSPEVSV